ncbi:otoancorin [Centropristis striata]|uniref:otoancorin n=1 Tax=Centropristis striata TaxID=184440 RepID=UPI0027E12A4D|nr:otoancorin [Centropristis striata]
MANMWNCSNLPPMVRRMNTSSEAIACYMRAYLAPLALKALTPQSECNMTSEDKDALLWAAQPIMMDESFNALDLPSEIDTKTLKKMLKKRSKKNKKGALNLVKEHFALKDFKCTTRPQSDSRTVKVVPYQYMWICKPHTQIIPINSCRVDVKPFVLPPSCHHFSTSVNVTCNSLILTVEGMVRCNSSVPWLNSEALEMLGFDIDSLKRNDVNYSPKEQLCEFFRSNRFRSATSGRSMKPTLRKTFGKKFRECFKGKELAENTDKMGVLACDKTEFPDLTPDLSKKFLSDLDNLNCENPRIKLVSLTYPSLHPCPHSARTLKVRKRLIRFLMSKNNTEDLQKFASSVLELPIRQLKRIPPKYLEELVKGKYLKLSLSKQKFLYEKICSNKCKDLSGKELIELSSIVRALPNGAFKRIKEILNNTEGLKNVSRYMTKAQRWFVVDMLSKTMSSSQLVEKLPRSLLCRLPIDKLNDLTTSDIKKKTWCLPQAAQLAKKMFQGMKNFSGKRIPSGRWEAKCEILKNVSDSKAKEMAQNMTDAPKWLNPQLKECVAEKLFTVLEAERDDYFETITEEEIDKIPKEIRLRLLAKKLKDLPDSVCDALLDLKDDDLKLIPRRSKTRPAFTERALLCLADGEDLSVLTNEDVLRLGSLKCELQASQLRLMDPDVLEFTLEAMAFCKRIPKRNTKDIIDLLIETYGKISDWSDEIMETVGPLLLLDVDAISALPNKVYFSCLLLHTMLIMFHSYINKSLHMKRGFSTLHMWLQKNRQTRSADTEGPTEDNIEMLGMDNIFWKPEELKQMSNATFINSIEIFAAIPDFREQQLEVLLEKAMEIIPENDDCNVREWGCITRGLPEEELEECPFLMDELDDIAHCDWNETKVKAVWKAIAKTNNLTAEKLKVHHMVALNRFICGLSSEEIQQLNKDAFKEAVGSIDVCQCSFEVLQQFKSLAVSAFGSPENWSEARVSELGCIVAGLNGTELASLGPSVFSYLNETCVKLIPPENFAKLSEEQLMAFESATAVSVTKDQEEALGEEQMEALEMARTGDIELRTETPETPETPEKYSYSGAPSLSVEGIAAVMKPLLFLLMGFLLL